MAIGNTNILHNYGDRAWLRFIESGTIAPADTAIEANTVTGLVISGVSWTSDGEIRVDRGASTVLSLHGSGHIHENFELDENQTQNVHVTFVSAGTLFIDVTKKR